jgi:hypothetical protein
MIICNLSLKLGKKDERDERDEKDKKDKRKGQIFFQKDSKREKKRKKINQASIFLPSIKPQTRP